MFERAFGGWPGTVHRPPLALIVLLLAYVGLTIGFNLATPVGEGPDEPEHFAFVQHLREDGDLPIAPASAEEGMIQAKHPPLYYGLATLLSLPWDIGDLGFVPNPFYSFELFEAGVPNAMLHLSREAFPYRDAPEFLAARVMRLLSLLCGLVTVIVTWALARAAWPERPPVAWLAASMVAFLPGFLFGSAVFSNDAAANASAALAFLAALRLARPGAGHKEALLAGIALGLCLLSKLTTLPLLGLVGLAWLLAGWRDRDLARAARQAAWIALPVVLISGWWFLRNMWLYGWTDPLGWKRFSGRAVALARELPLREELGLYWQVQAKSFWGWFGWLAVQLPAWQYRLAAGLALLALAGLLVFLLRDARGARPETRRALALALVCAAAVYLMVFRLAFDMNLVVAHGRLLYTALPALALLAATGLLAWLPRSWEPPLALLLVLLLFGLASQSLLTVLEPAYRGPAARTGGLPDPATSVGSSLGGQVTLLGYTLQAQPSLEREQGLPIDSRRIIDASRASAGGAAGLSGVLYWRAAPDIRSKRAPGSPGLVVFAHLVDREGALLGRWDGAPFEGRHPFLAWQSGEVYGMPFEMTVDPEAGWGLAELRVGVYPEGRIEDRLVVDAAGAAPSSPADPASSLAPDGAIAIGPLVVLDPRFVEAAVSDGPPLAVFGAGRQVELLGAEITPAEDALNLSLRWARPDATSLDPAALGDATVFVHLVDADGEIVGTADGPLAAGRFPIAYWPPDRVILDEHRLGRPGDLGDLSRLGLEIGLYDSATVQRFPAFDPRGRALADEALRIPDLSSIGLP